MALPACVTFAAAAAAYGAAPPLCLNVRDRNRDLSLWGLPLRGVVRATRLCALCLFLVRGNRDPFFFCVRQAFGILYYVIL